MANTKMDAFLSEYNGRLDDVVFYTVGKKTYARRYVKPRNPNSEAQKAQRSLFAEAMKEWKKLSREEQLVYKKKTRNTSLHPHNLFVKKYTALHKQKKQVKHEIIVETAPTVDLSETVTVQPEIKYSTEHRSLSEAAPYALRNASETAVLQLFYSYYHPPVEPV
jgi:hypothetical protein